MTPIKTGLSAFGLSGKVFHAPFIDLHPGFELTAVVERSRDEARTLYEGVRSVRSYEELLQLEELELVVVNTPDPTHYDYCRMALEAGKNVVVEKPFVFSSAQARELTGLAARKGLLLTVFQNRRFDGDFLTVKQVIDSGALGRVVEFQSAFQRYRPELSPIAWKESGNRVGITYNLCSHLCDQALALFGKPEGVWATMASQRDGSRIDDYCRMQLAYPEVKVSLRAGMLIREEAARFAVHGTKGSYVKFGLDPQEGLLRAGARPTAGDWAREAPEQWGVLNTDEGRRSYETVTGNYLAYYDNIYKVLREAAQPCVTTEDMLADVRMLESAFESAESGCTVKL